MATTPISQIPLSTALIDPSTGLISLPWSSYLTGVDTFLDSVPTVNNLGSIGVATVNGRNGAVTLSTNDITTALGFTPLGASGLTGYAPLNSPVLQGTPTAPTAAAGTNTNQVATTQFVTGALASLLPVLSFNNRTGAITLNSTDISNALGYVAENTAKKGIANGYASLDATGVVPLSQLPASLSGGLNFKGVWNAATNIPHLASGVGTKGDMYKVSVGGTTNLDGTVKWNIGDILTFDGTTWDNFSGNGDAVTTVFGRTGDVILKSTDITTAGGALLNSPSFTGSPSVPLPPASDYSLTVPNTIWVTNQIQLSQQTINFPVVSFNGRTGRILLTTADVTNVLGGTPVSQQQLFGLAPLDSPQFSGRAKAETADDGQNDLQIANTQWVNNAIAEKLPVYNFNGGNVATTNLLFYQIVLMDGGKP